MLNLERARERGVKIVDESNKDPKDGPNNIKLNANNSTASDAAAAETRATNQPSARSKGKSSSTSSSNSTIASFISAVLYELQPFRIQILWETSYRDIYAGLKDKIKFVLLFAYSLLKLVVMSLYSRDRKYYYSLLIHYGPYFVLSIALIIASIQLKVFNLLTMLFAIYLCFALTSADDSASRPGYVSAYSVFNKGFHKLPGTFTAEDIDRQLRSGMM